jgi:D-sedoheptulose 7-phosphate isomerase
VDNEPQNRLLKFEGADSFNAAVDEAITLLNSIRHLARELRQAAALCVSSLNNGRKLLVCGNGGSASEAQHLVGELVGRYKGERIALPAISMTADSTVLTCIANDFCYDDVFARQIQALGKQGDVLVAFSTSGHARNVIEALRAARKLHLSSIAFLGRDGGLAAPLADCALIIPHTSTARIQEGHQFLMHSMMDVIEAAFANASP